MQQESLKNISWEVSEEIYRMVPALSYSILSKYERGGFGSLSTLFDKVESPSFLFGSALDTYLTEGTDTFFNKYYVGESPSLPPSQVSILETIFNMLPEAKKDFSTVTDELIIQIAAAANFQARWTSKVVVEKIRETAQVYTDFLIQTDGKTLLPTELYKQVVESAECLIAHPATEQYFKSNNPFDLSIEYLNQMKFKATLGQLEFRCMADKIICDHTTKTITPIDLKTTSSFEWDFYKSFVTYRYDIQARLYWRIIRKVMDAHPVFKDYTLKNYLFIVINKDNLTPIVWEYPDTMSTETLVYGKYNQIVLRDPEEIAVELKQYLNIQAKVPATIAEFCTNNLLTFLSTL